MKLLLHQKALLIWDENKHQKPAAIHHTGVIITRWLIDPEGHLHPQDNADPDHNEYSLLAASSENWGRILDHPSVWRTIAANLQPHPAGRLGIDLRDAPPASTPVWEAFLKELSRTLRRNKFDLLVLPISSQQKRFIRSFWRNLPLLSRYAHRIALEPALDLSSSERCLASPRLLPIAKKLQAINLASKCLWVTDTAGWDWNLTQSRPAKISYKEAKILRAALTGPALNYDPKLQLIRGGFQKHQENHILIYRDLTGWTAWLRLMARSGLHGVIVRNFGDLGKAGPALLAESFAILPAESDQAT